MICRWWVLKMKWGRQEPEEEMDERQEVELLGSKGIPDLGSVETETCFRWLIKAATMRFFSVIFFFFNFLWIIGTGGSKRIHHLVSNSMTPAAHMSGGHMQTVLSHVRWWGGGRNSSVSFAWIWDPRPEQRNRPEKAAVPRLSYQSRHITADVDQKHACFYMWIYVDTKEHRVRIVKFKPAKQLFWKCCCSII